MKFPNLLNSIRDQMAGFVQRTIKSKVKRQRHQKCHMTYSTGTFELLEARLVLTQFAALVQSVTQVVSPGAPGPVYDTTGDWAPIVGGDVDTSFPATFALARDYGSGRVVVFGHDGIVTATGQLDNGQFLENATRWLDVNGGHQIRYSTAHSEFLRGTEFNALSTRLSGGGYSFGAVSGQLTAASLSGVSVLVIGNAWGSFTAAEIEAVRQFVDGGGGLWLIGLGWSWEQYHLDQTMEDYPMTQMAAPFGARWLRSITSDPTNNLDGSPIYHTFYPNVTELSVSDAIGVIRTAHSNHSTNLHEALETDATLRASFVRAHNTLTLPIAELPEQSLVRQQLFDEFESLANDFPASYSKSATFNQLTLPTITWVRERFWRTWRDAVPLTASTAEIMITAGRLSADHASVLRKHGVVLLDNVKLGAPEVQFIDRYLDLVPAELHNLRSISVRDFLGTQPAGISLEGNPGAVNIFGLRIGDVSENPFPNDVNPVVADTFTQVVAHEVNHVIDAFAVSASPALSNRKSQLIAHAGDEPANYLRSMFESGFFTNAPQEFVASISNQWFSDSARAFQLGLSRFAAGRHEPLNQVLFFTDIYSLGTDESFFYRIDAMGNIIRERVLLHRDTQGYIDQLTHGGITYRFGLVGDGHVVAVDSNKGVIVDLGSLDGANGFRLNGIDNFSFTGASVSNAGDVNGDGFDDLIIGAPLPVLYGNADTGASYVVFGKSSGFPATLDLSTLNGTNGFRLDGINISDRAGVSVSSAGDVNGDGVDDLVIGAYYGDPNGNQDSGEVYIVFGEPSGFPAVMNLATLDGTNGFRLNGANENDNAGGSVAGAGDVNGDGFDDFVIGAYGLDSNGNDNVGGCYVVFGKSNGFNVALDLATLDGMNGFRMDGISSEERAGISVSGAGDVDGDGLKDLIIGTDLNVSYIVFGRQNDLGSAIDLSMLNGTNGFRLDGGTSLRAVSSAGDVNGDGFDDVIIGDPISDADGVIHAGQSYVVFGKGTEFEPSLDLSTLDGVIGFRLDGIDLADSSGWAVSSAGDMNGDGYDDLLIGAFTASDLITGNVAVGEAYVVLGKERGFLATIDLASLDGTNGFQFPGIDNGGTLGSSVSNAGDLNGDGFGDILIGAPEEFTANSDERAGATYVVFGRNLTGGVETQVGTSSANRLTANRGLATRDILIGQQGADTLVSDGGTDVLYGGEGADTLGIIGTTFQRVAGGSGTDIFRLDSTGISLDLTTLADNKLTDIEVIDITGSGNNSLTLNRLEVLNISSTSNVLMVRRNTGDVVNMGTGWIQGANEVIGLDTFEVFTQGAATLKVQVVPPVAAVVTNGVLVINTQNAATDVRVTLNAGQIAVTSFNGSEIVATFTFAAASATRGIQANLSPAADRFDASAVSLPTTIFGGDGNDTLIGSPGIDSIFGDGGNDVISLLGGDDWAFGGAGNDTISGGAGRDSLTGGEGADRLLGLGGVDTLEGGAGIDRLDGGTSASAFNDLVEGDVTLTNTGFTTARGDTVIAESIGTITLTGGAGAESFNSLAFTSGSVTIFGGDGNDTMRGGAGKETYFGEAGNDVLNGGGGQDVLYGGDGNDTLNGVGAADILSGGAGNDRIVGGDGDNQLRETVDGNAGATVVVSTNATTRVVTISGIGTDTLVDAFTSLVLTGSGGNDVLDVSAFLGATTVYGGAGNDVLHGSGANDRLFGDLGNDTLNGNGLNDVLEGGAGDDVLNGGSGDDALRGAEGADQLDGGTGTDRAFEQANADFVITATQISSSATGTENLVGIERVEVSGGSGANKLDARLAAVPVILIGSNGNDTLLGGAFNDTLEGGLGDDVLSGGAGNDSIAGSTGNDIQYETLNVNATITGTKIVASTLGSDSTSGLEGIVLVGGVNANLFNASAATVRVTLLGGDGNDTLIGGAQPDFLIGGNRANSASGTDSLTGNAGVDVLDNDPADTRVDAGADTLLSNIFASLPNWIDTL